MTDDHSLQALRQAFDDSFARAPADSRQASVTLLIADIGAERFALPLAELSGFEPLRRCVPVAGAAAGVAGLVGVRGRTVPVFDLAEGLGLSEVEPLRWLALQGHGSATVAFGFARFVGQVQVAEDRLQPALDALARPHVTRLLTLEQRPIAVVSLASMAAVRHG